MIERGCSSGHRSWSASCNSPVTPTAAHRYGAETDEPQAITGLLATRLMVPTTIIAWLREQGEPGDDQTRMFVGPSVVVGIV